MPLEIQAAAPRQIAVVGGGIAGLAAAHFLSDAHHVTLYEAESRLGGHARTVMAGRRRDRPVDTGFIVFNRPNYPRLCRLFDALEVPVAPSDMSFAASFLEGRIEYGLRNFATVVAQPSNLTRPGFLAMIRDIVRFNSDAPSAADDPRMTVADLLDRMEMGRWFRERYLLPLSGAIWSTPARGMLAFPAVALVSFFERHALLGCTGQHRWLTVRGGSAEYVRRLCARLKRQGVAVRAGAPVAGVRRHPGGAQVRAFGGDWTRYDEVIFATHADVSLRLLADATGLERTALGAIRYRSNRAVLHADPSVMPCRRRTWSSWNYVEGASGPADDIGITYWMNLLQGIPRSDPLFVTLNPARPPRDDLIYDDTVFRHPTFDLEAHAAQETVRAMNGAHRTWYCGAWMRNGFHEDGLASAAEVASLVGADVPVTAAV